MAAVGGIWGVSPSIPGGSGELGQKERLLPSLPSLLRIHFTAKKGGKGSREAAALIEVSQQPTAAGSMP